MTASGLHHVTGITADVQADVDFYVGFLGLKLVKRTGGNTDAEQLHLIYGDSLGSPGSLLTLLRWDVSLDAESVSHELFLTFETA